LRRLKSEGKPVRILARRPLRESAWDPNVEVVYGDLGHPESVDLAMEGIDTVYHVGATMAGGKADHERGSIVGTRNVVDSCLRHRVRRLVYVSSIIHLHYSAHESGKAVDESYPLEPHADKRGFYTQAKLQAEQIVKDAIRDHQLPAVILRPGQIFGRGAEKSAPTGAIGLGGRWVVIGSGKLPLPLVYVEDVVDALMMAAKNDGVLGSIFNIVDPTVVTQNEYVAYCRRFFGNDLKVVYAPKPVMFLAALAADVVSKLTRVALPLSIYRLESSRPIHPFNVSAATRRLGWTPRIGSVQGLEETFGRERTGATSKAAVAVAGS
jgi:2-alkyl-3-oxoalkanoate reductase